MNIMVTGGSGFIGKHLVQALINNGHEVHLFKRESKLSDFENLKLDGVIHLATHYVAKHTAADVDKIIECNISLPIKILDFCLEKEIKWFLNTNSIAQFKDGVRSNPSNLYLASKQSFLEICNFYASLDKIKMYHLTVSDTFGAGDTRKKVMQKWKEILGTNNEMKMSKGEQVVHMLYIEDVISAYLKFVELISDQSPKLQKNNYFLNYSSEMTLFGLGKIVEKVTGKKLPISWGALPYQGYEVFSSQVGELLPEWKPEFGLEEGIRKYFLS